MVPIAGAPPHRHERALSVLDFRLSQETANGLNTLLCTAKSHEVQIHALRADHEALRTEAAALRACLARAGVLSGKDVDEEIGKIRSTSGGMQTSATAPAPANAAAAPSSLVPALKTPNTPRLSARPLSARGRHSLPLMEIVPPMSPRRANASAASSSNAAVMGSAPATSGTNTASMLKMPLSARGIRSVPLAEMVPPMSARSHCPSEPENSGSGCRGRQGGRTRASSSDRNADNVPGSPRAPQFRLESKQDSLQRSSISSFISENTFEHRDLYDMAKPLVQRTMKSAADQKARLTAIQSMLKATGETPDRWRGQGMPLSAAVEAGHVELTKVLLRARASVNLSDERGVTALHMAAFNGYICLCQILTMAAADVNATDQHGQTALFFAPRSGICKVLVEKRTNPSILNNHSQSALHCAARGGFSDVFKWLSLRCNQSLIDHRDAFDHTAQSYDLQRVKARSIPRSSVKVESKQSGNSTADAAVEGPQKRMDGQPRSSVQASEVPPIPNSWGLAGEPFSRVRHFSLSDETDSTDEQESACLEAMYENLASPMAQGRLPLEMEEAIQRHWVAPMVDSDKVDTAEPPQTSDGELLHIPDGESF